MSGDLGAPALTGPLGPPVGTTTVLEETFGTVKKITFAWTSDAAGNVSAATAKAYSGQLLRFTTIPDGTAVPTAYTAKLEDEDAIDLLNALAARSTTLTEQVSVAANLGVLANDVLTLIVASAGNAKSGTAIAFIR